MLCICQKQCDTFGNRFTLNDAETPTFLGVRQSEFDTELTVGLSGNSPEAGITFYLSEEHHYDLAVLCDEKKRTLILRLRIGDAIMVVKEIELPDDAKVTLKVVSDPAQYHFMECWTEKKFCLEAHVQNTYLLKLQGVLPVL